VQDFFHQQYDQITKGDDCSTSHMQVFRIGDMAAHRWQLQFQVPRLSDVHVTTMELYGFSAYWFSEDLVRQ